MPVIKAFKFRLCPTPEQEKTLSQQFGASRFVYHYFPRARIDYDAAHQGEKNQSLRQVGVSLNDHDTAKMLTELKRQPDYDWLNEANSQALQAALRNLDTAYRNFFENRAEFPKFKSKRTKQSFHVPQHFQLDTDAGQLTLPKLTPLKIVVQRPLEGETKSVSLSRTPSGRSFASILCETEVKPKPRKTGRVVGLDLGLKHFAVMSDGEKVDPPHHFRNAEAKLARLQRRFARKQKGSQGRAKARWKVARQHETIANQRADFLHQLSRRRVDKSQARHVESLNVMGRMGNHPLAKSIGDSGWGEFVRQLENRSEWGGRQLGKIARFFASGKRHAACGYIDPDLQLSEREWTRPECGDLVDQDENAAQTVLPFGQLSDSTRRRGTRPTQRRGSAAHARRHVEPGSHPLQRAVVHPFAVRLIRTTRSGRPQ